MRARPYQEDALDAIGEAWRNGERSALVSMPTGTGKTVVFTHAAALHSKKRTVILAHRAELIFQAAAKVEAVTGIRPEIEMAGYYADTDMFDRAPVVVSSVQTQCSRMKRFRPDDFDLVIVDEAHHAVSKSYRQVIGHYMSNPGVRLLGVTATPVRGDGLALGSVFDHVAYQYDVVDAISDGYLVPITQQAVTVGSIDLSTVSTTSCGDLNGRELAAVMEYEANIHGVVHPTIELAGDRRTIMFAASVAQADRCAEVFNRHRPGCAYCVHGKTPPELRKSILEAYAEGAFQYLVNVGVLTEGFDDPRIEVVALARPTKSRGLWMQMVGRGTRPAPGVVDGLDTAEERRAAIAASSKPQCEILCFSGNAGKHKLVSPVDLLGGKHPKPVLELARKKLESQGGGARNVTEVIEEAAEEWRAAEKLEEVRRTTIRMCPDYVTQEVSAFDLMDVPASAAVDYRRDRPATHKQVALLEKWGVKDSATLTHKQAQNIIADFMARKRRNKCTPKQAEILKRWGYPTDVSPKQAAQTIDALRANGWRRPDPLPV